MNNLLLIIVFSVVGVLRQIAIRLIGHFAYRIQSIFMSSVEFAVRIWCINKQESTLFIREFGDLLSLLVETDVLLIFSWGSQEAPANLVTIQCMDKGFPLGPIWLPYTHDRQTNFIATGVTDQSKL